MLPLLESAQLSADKERERNCILNTRCTYYINSFGLEMCISLPTCHPYSLHLQKSINRLTVDISVQYSKLHVCSMATKTKIAIEYTMHAYTSTIRARIPFSLISLLHPYICSWFAPLSFHIFVFHSYWLTLPLSDSLTLSLSFSLTRFEQAHFTFTFCINWAELNWARTTYLDLSIKNVFTHKKKLKRMFEHINYSKVFRCVCVC